MTYNEKRSLYESIMKDVAKTVKSRLNSKKLNEAHSNYPGIAEIMIARYGLEGYESIDEWLSDWNVFDPDMINAILDVIDAIADGDDYQKYSDLAQKYWE